MLTVPDIVQPVYIITLVFEECLFRSFNCHILLISDEANILESQLYNLVLLEFVLLLYVAEDGLLACLLDQRHLIQDVKVLKPPNLHLTP
jgi:hypothetical protein